MADLYKQMTIKSSKFMNYYHYSRCRLNTPTSAATVAGYPPTKVNFFVFITATISAACQPKWHITPQTLRERQDKTTTQRQRAVFAVETHPPLFGKHFSTAPPVRR